MHSSILLAAFSAFALARAQGIPGQDTIEGTPVYDGLPVPGTTGKLGDAAIVTDNPIGVTYTAVLPDSNTTNIRGYIAATSNANGTGVVFNINFYGFPDMSLGPFVYHIHAFPVPASGNCTETLGHIDPYIRGEIPPCDNTQPETCQVGDLAGKHGNITVNPFQVSYLDLYASNKMGIGAFLGNVSVNIHSSNTTRLTCANFAQTSGSSSNVTNGTAPTSPTPSPFKGDAAMGQIVSFAALAAGVVAFFL